MSDKVEDVLQRQLYDEVVEDALQRLFAGAEPKAAWLARCPTLERWRLQVRQVGQHRRGIVIDGTLTSERFTVKNQPPSNLRVLWLDRKLRFVVTKEGLWNLGEQESEVGMDFTVEKADD